jgi:predicted lipoprotein with Yx(FWY)xxD motif
MRIVPKPAWLLVLGLVLAMAASSCGGTTSSGATPTTATSYPTTAATPTTATTFTVQTAQATVNGKTTTILTNAQGLTLYSFTPDTASKTVCTGSCAQTWPPLLFTGTGKPTALPGEVEVYANANGKQVIYNDHPLYTYSGDSAAGQTSGEGLFGKWFVATPDLAKNKL